MTKKEEKLRDIEHLGEELGELFMRLKENPELVEQARAMSGISGKIIQRHNLEIKYRSKRGEKANIPFLHTKHKVDKIK